MYGKIFDSMYDGTISANWQGMVTFQQMIVLCDADGTLDMTPPALSRRTGIPLDIIEKGIIYLESPDPYSRTQGFKGARIVRLDEHRNWGWFIVNHEKYKSLQDADHVRAGNRKRKQKQRAKDAQNVTDGHSPSLHTDTDTNKTKKTNTQTQGFCAWWDVHPRKIDRKRAYSAWKSKKLESRSDELIAKLKDQIANCESFDRPITKIAHPTTYLNNDRFDNPIEQKQQANSDNKTNIKSEIFDRISKGYDGTHQWKSPEAQKVFEQMRTKSSGVPWTGNEWQINQAISEAL